MNPATVLVLEAVSAFIIGGSAALTGVMVGNGAVVMPTPAGMLLTVVAGLVAAANQFRARLAEPPKTK